MNRDISTTSATADVDRISDHYRRMMLTRTTDLPDDEQVEAVAYGFLLEYTGNTRAAYARDLRDYFIWCRNNGADVMSVTRRLVGKYASDLAERPTRPLSKASVARHLSTISGFYKYAEGEDIIGRNPVAHVKRPKVAKGSQQLGMDKGEVLRLVAAAKEHSTRAHALITLLLYDGLRISEALGAQVGDMTQIQGHRTLTITGKGDIVRVVTLNAPTVHALAEYVGDRTEGAVFLTSTGGLMDRAQAFRLVRQVARRAGLENWHRLGPHSLRHTFVTLSRQAGIPLEDVQDAAGHADPRTTRRYDRARFSLDRHPANRLAEYLATDAPPPQGED